MKPQPITLNPDLKTRLAALFALLATANVTTVTVEFNGSGDEGCAEDPVFEDGTATDALIEEARTIIDGILEASNYDWYNNKGGFGSVTLTVKTKAVAVDMNINEQHSKAYPLAVKL